MVANNAANVVSITTSNVITTNVNSNVTMVWTESKTSTDYEQPVVDPNSVDAPLDINATARLIMSTILILVVGFNIWYLTYRGTSGNLLHQTSLLWSWIIASGVLAGLGFSQIIDAIKK